MSAIDNTLRWFVRASIAIGLVILCYILFHGIATGLFRTEHSGLALFFATAWILPALALGMWDNDARGRQSIVFYALALASIGLIAVFGLFLSALSQSFS